LCISGKEVNEEYVLTFVHSWRTRASKNKRDAETPDTLEMPDKREVICVPACRRLVRGKEKREKWDTEIPDVSWWAA
jgi:hypothetical protein